MWAGVFNPKVADMNRGGTAATSCVCRFVQAFRHPLLLVQIQLPVNLCGKKRLGTIKGSIMAMGEIKYDDYTEEEQALMKGAPYVMKPLQGQDDAACHRSVGV